MERSILVRVRDGLHARPATRFVKLAKSFSSDVEITVGDKSANAKSSVRLMLLSIKENDTVTLKIDGTDAEEALCSLAAYLGNPEAGLEEDEQSISLQTHVPTIGTARLDEHKGIPASNGVAIGPAFVFFKEKLTIERRQLKSSEIDGEIRRYRNAVASVQRAFHDKYSAQNGTPSDHGIIEALAETVDDDLLRSEITTSIEGGSDAVSATFDASERISAEFAALEDPYLQARSEDIRAIGRQLCLALQGKTDPDLHEIPQGAIVVASDLSALDIASAPLTRMAGIICEQGAATSHIAIIARTHSIPAVLGVGASINQLTQAKYIALDGGSGVIHIDPDEKIRVEFSHQIEAAREERDRLQAFKSAVPLRKDGVVIEVAANLGALNEIETALAAGAMGVGLFRTELLFMQHKSLPDEETQFQAYSKLAQSFAPHSVIIRTLDIGGDKPVNGIAFPHEENPFLGWRGIRMCLDRPDIFRVQLRALLRAAVSGTIKVMIPMVSDLSEILETKVLIAQCADELHAEGIPHAEFALGIMIETPAAVMMANEFAKHVTFFSIGTNDLTQYIMAADRLNTSLARLCDVTKPAVMRAIEVCTKAGVEAGIMVGMCGEAAARTDLISTFVDMGITEFSMVPSAILSAKKTLLGL